MERQLADRRPHRRPSWRGREPISLRRDRSPRDNELARFMKNGNFNSATMERIAELLGLYQPRREPPGAGDAQFD
jgi:hypothetical protein